MQTTVSIQRIRPPRNNPRTFINEQTLALLVSSIQAQGVLQPLLVRPVEDEDGMFEVIAGEQRLRAATIAGLEEVPVYIKAANDDEVEEMAAAENTARLNMSPVDEAVAAQRILMRNNNDRDETARLLGWSTQTLRSRLALLALIPEARRALTEERLKLGHAELLATLAPEKQSKVLTGLLEHKVSVSDLQAQLASFAQRLGDAPFDTSQCADCKHNSAYQRALFDTSIEDGYCTHPGHYQELVDRWLESKAAPLREEYRVVQIYKTGDGFTPLPLKAEGALGVGAEQAEACKSCTNYGVGMSAVPGSYGKITGPNCFDAGCNATKVAARISAEKQAAKEAAGTSPAPSAPRPAHSQSTAKPAPGAKQATAQLSSGVHNYIVKQWRTMCAAELLARPEMGQRLLVALAVSGHGRDIDQDWCCSQIEAIAGEGSASGATLDTALRKALRVKHESLQALTTVVPASAAWKVQETDLNHLLNWLQVEETAHFKITADYLSLLTKAEIEAVATEVGLKKYLGDQFKKLRDGKKDELIKGMLSAPGFDFTGKLPSMLRYKRRPAQKAASRP